MGSGDPVPVAIALGSNLGDRESNLRQAIDSLSALISDIRLSAFHDTAPVGVGDQPRFLNAVLAGATRLSARDLLRSLLGLETTLGRTRPFSRAPRTIDLDLILYGQSIINEPGLDVPHPRFREREFVLAPFAEIAGNWIDPVTGETIDGLLRALRRGEGSASS